MHPEGLESLIEQARAYLPDMADCAANNVLVPMAKEIDPDILLSNPSAPIFSDACYVLRFTKEYISGIAVRWVFDGLDQGGF